MKRRLSTLGCYTRYYTINSTLCKQFLYCCGQDEQAFGENTLSVVGVFWDRANVPLSLFKDSIPSPPSTLFGDVYWPLLVLETFSVLLLFSSFSSNRCARVTGLRDSALCNNSCEQEQYFFVARVIVEIVSLFSIESKNESCFKLFVFGSLQHWQSVRVDGKFAIEFVAKLVSLVKLVLQYLKATHELECYFFQTEINLFKTTIFNNSGTSQMYCLWLFVIRETLCTMALIERM